MTRYFFDLSDGGWEPDRIGIEMSDPGAAQREAIRYAGEVLTHEPHRLEQGEMRVNVHTSDRSVRFAVVVRLVRE